MRKVLHLFFLICCLPLDAQEPDRARNVIYVGAGRQAMVYLKYERILLHGKYLQTNGNIGFASFPAEHDTPNEKPPHRIVTAQLVQLIGIKNFYLELGIEPAMHFFGNVTYTDLNGIAGVRYQSESRGGLFAQLGYNPRLFYTYESDIDVPFYAGVGIVF
jgi:hypothetical protein